MPFRSTEYRLFGPYRDAMDVRKTIQCSVLPRQALHQFTDPKGWKVGLPELDLNQQLRIGMRAKPSYSPTELSFKKRRFQTKVDRR